MLCAYPPAERAKKAERQGPRRRGTSAEIRADADAAAATLLYTGAGTTRVDRSSVGTGVAGSPVAAIRAPERNARLRARTGAVHRAVVALFTVIDDAIAALGLDARRAAGVGRAIAVGRTVVAFFAVVLDSVAALGLDARRAAGVRGGGTVVEPVIAFLGRIDNPVAAPGLRTRRTTRVGGLVAVVRSVVALFVEIDLPVPTWRGPADILQERRFHAGVVTGNERRDRLL